MNEDNSICLILDTGSYKFKAGISNEEFPKHIAPTLYGQTLDGSQYYTGNKVYNQETIHKKLINQGHILSWEKIEKFWENEIKNEMKLKPSERAVLTNYYINNSKYEKERQTQIFFESFNVPYYYSCLNHLLGLYSSGRINGVVIDSGHAMTSIVPIFEGCALNYAQINSDLAGDKITQKIIKKYGLNEQQANSYKEKFLRCEYTNDDFNIEETNDQQLKLPDGQQIKDPGFFTQLGDSMFQPELMGWDNVGIHYLINESLYKIEYDQRKELLNNIIMCGGNSNTKNFCEKLQKEFVKFLAPNTKIKIYSHNEKQNAIWMGGVILSTLGSFQPMWISRTEYDECGPSIVSRKNLQLILSNIINVFMNVITYQYYKFLQNTQ